MLISLRTTCQMVSLCSKVEYVIETLQLPPCQNQN